MGNSSGAGEPVSAYAELHCVSNFSFLRGASQPEELVRRAAELGYAALAITDECSVAGVVRAHVAAREQQIRLIIGSEFHLQCGLHIVLLAASRRGYGQLCTLITRGRRAAAKGSYALCLDDLAAGLDECMAIWVVDAEVNYQRAGWLQGAFPDRLWIAAELFSDGNKNGNILKYKEVSEETSIPLVACGDVHMHRRGRRALQDTVTAIRLGVTVAEAGDQLFANGERYLRSLADLTKMYPAEWLAASMDIAQRIDFSLGDLKYQYPA